LSEKEGYRTNIGSLSAVNMPIVLEVRLYDWYGTPLGTLTYPLQPYEFEQIDRIFRNVTASGILDGYAVLRTTTPGGRFFAYASVIDNATADPICVQPASCWRTRGCASEGTRRYRRECHGSRAPLGNLPIKARTRCAPDNLRIGRRASARTNTRREPLIHA
jgi:hypothetical protein